MIGVGIDQHPSTLLWQVWMSVDGIDLMLISAHQDREKAQRAMDALLEAGRLSDENQIAALLERLRNASDAEPIYFPEEMVVKILASLAVQQATVNLE